MIARWKHGSMLTGVLIRAVSWDCVTSLIAKAASYLVPKYYKGDDYRSGNGNIADDLGDAPKSGQKTTVIGRF